jgi:hypothetical protein
VRIIYDFGGCHDLPFYRESERQLNEALKEIIKHTSELTLANLKPPTEKIDKIFLEGAFENKKYTIESFRKDAPWFSSIKKLQEKYKSGFVGLEKPVYQIPHLCMIYWELYGGVYTTNKFLSKVCQRIGPVFSRARTYHFAKVVNRELEENEVGIAIHGKAHELTNYLNQIAPDIKIYPLEDKLASLSVEQTIKTYCQTRLKK